MAGWLDLPLRHEAQSCASSWLMQNPDPPPVGPPTCRYTSGRPAQTEAPSPLNPRTPLHTPPCEVWTPLQILHKWQARSDRGEAPTMLIHTRTVECEPTLLQTLPCEVWTHLQMHRW